MTSWQPFHEQLLESCKRRAKAPALTDGDGTITFEELAHISERLAAMLSKKGVAKGWSLLVCLDNDRWQPASFLAAALLGATVSGTSPHSTAEELRYFASRCDADFVIYNVELLDRVSSYLSHLPSICVGDAPYDVLAVPRDLPPFGLRDRFEACLDDAILQPFSSGTSGLPKCLVLTHRNLLAATGALKQALFDDLLRQQVRRVTASVLPLYHASGFWALAYCILEGLHVILLSSGHPRVLLETINKYKIETINVVPSLADALTRCQVSAPSLRYVLCGAGALSGRTEAALFNRFPGIRRILRGYGLTEVVVLSHVTPLEGRVPSGSCGRLLPGLKAKIISEDGSVVTRALQSGELLLHGDAVSAGYKEKNEDLIDGWLRTGDIAYVDPDGFYFIVDRKKDLIKVNGLQVSPTEVEEVILNHPQVEECAVIGIPHHSKGEVPKAFITLRSACVDHIKEKEKEHIKKQINSLIKEKLASHKQLMGGIEICAELPHSTSGKIQRRELRHHTNIAQKK